MLRHAVDSIRRCVRSRRGAVLLLGMSLMIVKMAAVVFCFDVQSMKVILAVTAMPHLTRPWTSSASLSAWMCSPWRCRWIRGACDYVIEDAGEDRPLGCERQCVVSTFFEIVFPCRRCSLPRPRCDEVAVEASRGDWRAVLALSRRGAWFGSSRTLACW